MKLKINRTFFYISIIAITIYVVFFATLWLPHNLIWGSDLEYKHFPSRWYLYQQIIEFGRFPFWTEKMFGGFKIFADSELGFLNPINLITLLIFGPALSIKILHLIGFLAGSFSFYILSKRKESGYWGFIFSTTIFYGAFFMVNHLIHLNLIMIAYLIPLNLLLSDLMIESIRSKANRKTLLYIFLNSLIFTLGFLWGHYQTSLFVIIIISIYSFSIIGFQHKAILFKTLLSIFLIGISSIIISLPQTYPTYKLYIQSERIKSDEINVFEGSYTPSLSILLIYPQIWGDFEGFFGKTYNDDYSYTEFYNYLGISVLILAFFILLFTKFDWYFKYFLYSYFIFVFFAFIAFMPFMSGNFPLLSGFRYWVRSVIVIITALSLLSFKVTDLFNPQKREFDISKIIFKLMILLVPAIYLFIAQTLNPNDVFNYNVFETIYYRNLLTDEMGVKWIFFALSMFIFLIFVIVKVRKINNYILAFIFLIILFDLRTFAGDALSARIKPYSIPGEVQNIPQEMLNKRIIVNESEYAGQRALYYPYWTPYGYSQYSPNKYVDKFTAIEVDVTSSRGEGFEDFQYVDELYELGVLGLFDNGKYLPSIEKEPDIHYIKQGDFKGKNIYSSETGEYKFEIDSDNSTYVDTFLKNDDEMDVFINGINFTPEARDTFMGLQLGPGKNEISIKYVPRNFYIGLLISVGYMLAFLFAIKKIKN